MIWDVEGGQLSAHFTVELETPFESAPIKLTEHVLPPADLDEFIESP
jgi:hypothetical protein